MCDIMSTLCHFAPVFFFQAEDGIRDLVRSRGLGDVYKRQPVGRSVRVPFVAAIVPEVTPDGVVVAPPGGLFDDDEATPD